MYYIRYMDDILILIPNMKAKKKAFRVLRDLKLERSPQKTLMGKIDKTE